MCAGGERDRADVGAVSVVVSSADCSSLAKGVVFFLPLFISTARKPPSCVLQTGRVSRAGRVPKWGRGSGDPIGRLVGAFLFSAPPVSASRVSTVLFFCLNDSIRGFDPLGLFIFAFFSCVFYFAFSPVLCVRVSVCRFLWFTRFSLFVCFDSIVSLANQRPSLSLWRRANCSLRLSCVFFCYISFVLRFASRRWKPN